MTTSGQEASFLAGGEFPVPVPQQFQTITIEWKKFGVGLNFTPTVLDNDMIAMQVNPEVSQLDFTLAITVAGIYSAGPVCAAHVHPHRGQKRPDLRHCRAS